MFLKTFGVKNIELNNGYNCFWFPLTYTSMSYYEVKKVTKVIFQCITSTLSTFHNPRVNARYGGSFLESQ